MNLLDSRGATTCLILQIDCAVDEMVGFLQSLGCYPGERIAVISRLAGASIVHVNHARYSIDDSVVHNRHNRFPGDGEIKSRLIANAVTGSSMPTPGYALFYS